MHRVIPGSALALLVLASVIGCGKLQSGVDVFTPETGVDVQLTAVVAPGTASDGDRVHIGGTFVPSWSESNWEARELFGSVQNGEITGSFSRSIPAAGEWWSVKLWTEHDGKFTRSLSGIKVNDVPLATVDATPFDFVLRFSTTRRSDGSVAISSPPERSLLPLTARYTGIALTGDGSHNDRARSDRAVAIFTSWNGTSGTDGHPSTWNGSLSANELGAMYATAKDGEDLRYYARFDDGTKDLRAGCFLVGSLNTLECMNMVNLGSDAFPWWFFEVRVAADGRLENPRPESDERWTTVVVRR